MSGRRTVTVRTLDHGPVILMCPAWCTVDHAAGPVEYRADVAHSGQRLTATVPFMPGGWVWLDLSVQCAPFAESSGRETYIAADVGGYTRRHTPATLRALVDVLTAQLGQVHAYADRLEGTVNGWGVPS